MLQPQTQSIARPHAASIVTSTGSSSTTIKPSASTSTVKHDSSCRCDGLGQIAILVHLKRKKDNLLIDGSSDVANEANTSVAGGV